ncbi:hypothetical protein REPUB_Repub06bG0054100 [Reevesia pubescens]
MAYIPPHKRNSKDSERPTPTPESLVPQFRRNVQLRAPKFNADRSGKIIYSNYAISRWFAVGLDDGNGDASAAHLKQVSVEFIERKTGEKPAILVKSNLDKENNGVKGNPWSSIAENVLPDLLSSFETARAEIKSEDLKDVKPGMVARFGKILFQGSPSVNLESVEKDCVTEATLRNLKRSFYTSLPASYAGNIMAEVVPKIGVDFAEVKDIYHVKLSDSTRPDVTITCKCSVKDDDKLQLYKVELNPVRDMVVDISCPDMDLDLRLMLSHKRILTSQTEDEIQSFRNLIDSAVLDPDAKGGLRWPLGKASSGNRYNVVGVWHTRSTAYENSSIRLKVRYANRFDFRTSYGEASKEVLLKLKGMISGLLEQEVNKNVISDMLKDTLSLIWQHFLRYSNSLLPEFPQMKPNLFLYAKPTANSLPPFLSFPSNTKTQISLFKSPTCLSFSFKSFPGFVPLCSSNPSSTNSTSKESNLVSNGLPQTSKYNIGEESNENYNVGVGNAIAPTFISTQRMSLSVQAFYLLAFIACTTSVAFTSLVIAAVPTLHAMRRAAVSLSKLADTAREELPSTMAAIRLSGMEISDLTLELSDLSQEIVDGVNKSAQAVQAAEAGIRQIGSLAHQQTMSMIQERASLPIISLQPVVAGAARKTSHAVGQATKTIMNVIYRGEFSSENNDESGIDRLEI